MGVIVFPTFYYQPSYSFPLDGLSLAAFAHSDTRRLYSNYTGSLIQIRRDDGNFIDIGYTSNNEVDYSQILSFTGSGNAWIQRRYDQSGNGRHCVQLVSSFQPQIVANGSLILNNGKLAPTYDGINDFFEVANSTQVFNNRSFVLANYVGRFSPTATSERLALVSATAATPSAAARFILGAGIPPGKYRMGYRRLDTDPFTSVDILADVTTSVSISTGLLNYASNSSSLYLNNSLIGSGVFPSGSGNSSNITSSFNIRIGSGFSVSFYQGFIAEDFLIPSSVSSLQREAIVQNQVSFYGAT